ncbi:MAG: hypothetical protein ABI462_05315 [Ignavibacteria bacterium]
MTGVSGKNQYSYDGNGNMTRDDLNRNSNIKYDYRNLIIQLKQKVFVARVGVPKNCRVLITIVMRSLQFFGHQRECLI